MAPELHLDLEPLALLLGSWEGSGRGVYPTIDDFGYREEVTISHVGKPFLTYSQRTFHDDDGRPLHAETGYWRVHAHAAGGARAELVLAHPTGVTEIQEGEVVVEPEETVITLVSTSVALTATAKDVQEVRRTLRLSGDTLSYTVAMAAVGRELQPHLRAELSRQR
jgi:hypothetical protein